MEDAVIQRIGVAIKSCGYKSVNAFSKATGISQPTLSNCVGGKREPRLTLLLGILKGLPGISAEWLLTGEGSMYKEVQNTDNVQAGTNDTGSESGERSADANIEIALLKKEIECLKGEIERLRTLISGMCK